MKGKSDVTQVTRHFQNLEREGKNIIRGWAVPENVSDEQNIITMTKHFDELKYQDKCSLFVLYQKHKSISIQHGLMHPNKQPQSTEINEVHLYVVPITDKTFNFCQAMQVLPPSAHFKQHPHLFAFFAHIKHPNYSLVDMMNISRNPKQPTLNPVLIQEAAEFASQNHNLLIKEEPLPQPPHLSFNSQAYFDSYGGAVSQEDAQVDQLIFSLKQRNARYEDIMNALLPYISQKNISQKSEMKLTEFIKELIEQRSHENKQMGGRTG